MKILVTGSAGHLGEALMRTLRARGDVTAIGTDVLASPWTDARGSIVDPRFAAAVLQGVDAVLHAATLHKPHIVSHTRQDFVDVNVTGTLNLLEAAVAKGVRAFVYTSTTSAFGQALRPEPDAPAVWIDEGVVAPSKNVYGATKVAAEDLCEIVHRDAGLPVVVLRTSRLFPEDDDLPERRDAHADANLKVNELLYRRADIADIVDAHLLAIARAPALGFAKYVVSATSPFTRDDLALLRTRPAEVVARHVPGYADEYAKRGWSLEPSIDRVYVNARARAELGWTPKHDFATSIARLRAGLDYRSDLAIAVGAKGYHRA